MTESHFKNNWLCFSFQRIYNILQAYCITRTDCEASQDHRGTWLLADQSHTNHEDGVTGSLKAWAYNASRAHTSKSCYLKTWYWQSATDLEHTFLFLSFEIGFIVQYILITVPLLSRLLPVPPPLPTFPSRSMPFLSLIENTESKK